MFTQLSWVLTLTHFIHMLFLPPNELIQILLVPMRVLCFDLDCFLHLPHNNLRVLLVLVVLQLVLLLQVLFKQFIKNLLTKSLLIIGAHDTGFTLWYSKLLFAEIWRTRAIVFQIRLLSDATLSDGRDSVGVLSLIACLLLEGFRIAVVRIIRTQWSPSLFRLFIRNDSIIYFGCPTLDLPAGLFELGSLSIHI